MRLPVGNGAVPRWLWCYGPLALAWKRFPVAWNVSLLFKRISILAELSSCTIARLSNEKPSAIFRLRGTFSSSSNYTAFGSMDAPSQPGGEVTAMLGFSIEPLHQIQPQIDAIHGSSSSVTTLAKPSLASNPTLLAEKIVRHLLNYITSYTGSAPGSQTAVPMSMISKWYESLTSKIKNSGIGFLEKDD